jgi:DNA repair exonuclease SbcCD ATPase subunit
MKLQSLTSDYDYMNGNVEKQIENGNVERLMEVLNNQMPDDVEIESFKDLKAQAEDLKEVIQLESEAEEIVKDQIQRLEEQLNELEKMQKRVSNMESREASDTYYDEETEAEVKEMDNLREQLAGRMSPVTQDLKRSKKVLEELEEVKALEQDHYEKVEGILEMEQS